jgi:exodeoxyribonuclease VII large subunit
MRIGGLLEERLNGFGARLEALSPLRVLSRGFSVTLKMPGKKVLKSVTKLKKGDTIQTLLRDGEILSTAHEIRGNS